MSSRQGLLLLLLVLAAALALRLAFYIGPYTTDCFGNAQFAYQVAAGEFDLNKEYYAANRIGFVFPMGLAVWALGFQPFAYSLVGLLCSLGCVALAYVLGARLYDRKAGLVAATILAVMPLEIFMWSPLLIDAVTPFYWGLSLGLFYLGLAEDPPARRPSLLLFASGAALGLATYTREHAPVVFLVMLAYLVARRRRPPRRVLWVLGGFCAVALAGELYYFAASGVPFLRVRRLWEHFGPGTGAAEPGAIEIGRFEGLRPWFLQSMLTAPDYFGFVFWVAWIAALVLLARRRRENLFPLTWFLGLYVLMDFALRTFVRLLAYPPYINVLDLPAALLIARFLGPRLSGARAPARAWASVLGVVLALAGVTALALHSALTSSFDTWAASSLGGWGRAHAHDARFATLPILAGSLLAALGATLAWRAAPFRWRPGWGSAVLLFLIVSSVFITSQGVRWRRAEAAPLKKMAGVIEPDSGRPVYLTSLWSATGLNFFLDYRTNFRRYWNRWEAVRGARGLEFRELPESIAQVADDAYVAVDKRAVQRWQAGEPAVHDVVPVPAYARTAPSDWRLLFDSKDYALYRMTRGER